MTFGYTRPTSTHHR